MNNKQEIIPYEEVFRALNEANSYNSRMKKAMKKGKKILPYKHLDHILKNTTPYQRMIWLKKAIEFWKIIQKQKQLHRRLRRQV